MQANEFAKEFGKLGLAKQTSIDELMIEVYWEDLKELKYLRETLQEARRRTFYRDFDKSITRMPETSELLRIHREIFEDKVSDSKFLQIETSCNDNKKSQIHANGMFMFDLVTHFNIKATNALWKKVDLGEIKVPVEYFELRDKFGVKRYLSESFQEIIDGCEKRTPTKHVGGLNTVLKGLRLGSD